MSVDVRLPDVVVVDAAVGGLDRGQVGARGVDHALQRGVELRVLVSHVGYRPIVR